jgi:hypothetical protein
VSAPRTVLAQDVSLASISTGTGVPAIVSWDGSDGGATGIASYDVARSRDGAPFELLASRVAESRLAVSLPPGHTDRFQVRARDRAGNVSDWRAGPVLRPDLVQQWHRGLDYAGPWRLGRSRHYSAESSRFSAAARAAATLAFTGRGIGFVTTRGPDRGAVKVILDGRLVATLDLGGDWRYRDVAFARTWATSGFHTIRLVVVGRQGRARVDLDALTILR